jgi:hypothetical protein
MAWLEDSTYTTIKEAIINSTADNGLIACYIDKDGKRTYFVNGKPVMEFKK